MNSLVFSLVVLGLAWFAAVNLAASLLAWALARWFVTTRAVRRDELLLAIRLLPATISLVFVGAVFLPGHWRLEPRDAEESFGLACRMLALSGMLLLGRSAWRVAIVGRAGWRLRAWVRMSGLASDRIIYGLPGLPGVSLVGVLRTRVLVGFRVQHELTAAELDMAVAHEMAHRRAFDNLKRLAMFCAPDLFGSSATARRLEDRWRETAELTADARAVDGDQRRAVHLASALVKVARLGTIPLAAFDSRVWSTLHTPGLLETRVRRLAGSGALPVAPSAGSDLIVCASIIALVVLASVAVPPQAVHQITESLVRILP